MAIVSSSQAKKMREVRIRCERTVKGEEMREERSSQERRLHPQGGSHEEHEASVMTRCLQAEGTLTKPYGKEGALNTNWESLEKRENGKRKNEKQKRRERNQVLT